MRLRGKAPAKTTPDVVAVGPGALAVVRAHAGTRLRSRVLLLASADMRAQGGQGLSSSMAGRGPPTSVGGARSLGNSEESLDLASACQEEVASWVQLEP